MSHPSAQIHDSRDFLLTVISVGEQAIKEGSTAVAVAEGFLGNPKMSFLTLLINTVFT